MRKFLSLIALTLFYTLLVIALMESGTRLFHLARPAESPGFFWQTNDPVTGWRMTPNAEGRWFNDLYEYDTHIQVNSRGLRAPEEIGYEKPAGVYRVIVLGDSFVEAAQVELAESFPQQLGALLRAQGLKAEVLNVGAGGWGNDQELIWLREEGYQYKPDLVILAVFPRNDFMNNSQSLESANMGKILKPFFRLEDGKLVPEFYPYQETSVPPVQHPQAVAPALEIPPGPLLPVRDWLWEHSALYRYLDPRLRTVAPRFVLWLDRIGLMKPGDEAKGAAQDPNQYPLPYNVYHPTPDAEWQRAFAVTEAIFGEIHRLTTGMGAQAAALLVTAPEQVLPGYWDTVLQNNPAMHGIEWSLDAPFQRANEALQRAGFLVLNPLPVLRTRQAAGENLHFREDGHWTAAGHDLVAKLLFNFVSSKAIVPQLKGATLELSPTPLRRLVWRWLAWLILLALVGSLLWSIYKNGLFAWLRNLAVSLNTVGELVFYTIRRRQFILLPVLVVLLLFGALLVVAQASVVGPFIYTLF